jgi:predicted transcriptional regulator
MMNISVCPPLMISYQTPFKTFTCMTSIEPLRTLVASSAVVAQFSTIILHLNAIDHPPVYRSFKKTMFDNVGTLGGCLVQESQSQSFQIEPPST